MQPLETGYAEFLQGSQLEAGVVAFAHPYAGHVRVGQHAAVLVHHGDFGARYEPELANLLAQIGERHIQANHRAAVLAGLA